ncbi:tripartite tricarboxylate transporter TctB family protein (plasmid) [Salipiger sp. H15]|uniref:Tripartite tricarboxylate transporter TctB family protein n=1 Tax=Alloyangia sp. H15 TaxID=3029062 RepID=A0AAU8ARN3_9RHOB
MRLLSGRILFDLVLLAGAAWGLWQAQLLPPAFGGGDIGPADFPRAVLILGLLALLEVLRQDLRGALRGTDAQAGPPHLPGILAALTVGGLLVLYVLLLEPLGFLPATAAFLMCCILTCSRFLERPEGRAGWGRVLLGAAVTSVLATGLSYAVFTYGFGLIFP